MKPVVQLAQAPMINGHDLFLHEHDGSYYLKTNLNNVASTFANKTAQVLAELACAPITQAKQPKVFFLGLGLGNAVAAVGKFLPQKGGKWFVYEPSQDLVDWHGRFLPESVLNSDPRIELLDANKSIFQALVQPSQPKHHAVVIDYHAIETFDSYFEVEDESLLQVISDSLISGGILAILVPRVDKNLTKALQRCGFSIAIEKAPLSEKSSRCDSVVLAIKGRYEKKSNSRPNRGRSRN